MKNLHGFYNQSEARKASPAVSRPDLVAARNAAIRGPADLRPHERKPVQLSQAPMDSRIRFYRPVNDGKGGYRLGSCYAILSLNRVAQLRKEKRLESWLHEQRESGVVIRA